VSLRVLEIFDSIQGEGYWTGTPMTFVRLAGCNAWDLELGCLQWCDTRDSWNPDFGDDLEVSDVILQVRLPCVCVTGGEPLLQKEYVARLAAEARGLGMRLHIETNGTISPPAPDSRTLDGRVFDWATVSPKPPGYEVVSGWRGHVDEIKLVVDDHLTTSIAERVAAAHPEAVVFLQPVWDAPATDGRHGEAAPGPGWVSTQRSIAMVMDHPEWRLSLQTHKFLGIK
jgi:7-carboxy-7-deazaguanine synthase